MVLDDRQLKNADGRVWNVIEIWCQYWKNYILEFIRHRLGHWWYYTIFYFFSVLKRPPQRYELKKCDSKAPNVNFEFLFIWYLFSINLPKTWVQFCNVISCCMNISFYVSYQISGWAKICNFHDGLSSCWANQNIVRLEISMNDSIHMAVCNSHNWLCEDVKNLYFIELL